MTDKTEKRLLKLVEDYISGNFTIASEKPLVDEIIKLTSPTLSASDVFYVLFEGEVQTSEEGVVALRSFVEAQAKS